MTMRVYILYERSRSVFIPLLALWLGTLAVSCVRMLPQWVSGSITWRRTVGSVLQQSPITFFSGLHDPITTGSVRQLSICLIYIT